MRVYLTTNSPGEVATWVRPVVDELDRVGRAYGEEIEVYVFVTPCRYASGTEAEVIRPWPRVARVFSTRETAKFAVLGIRPQGFAHEGRGVLLFLGGEMKLAAWLKRRLGVPGAVYTEGFVNTAKAFQRVYVPHGAAKARAMRHGATERQLRVVGNLMVDSVQGERLSKEEARRLLGLTGDGPVVAVFPGSREFEWRILVPFFMAVLGQLRERLPGLVGVVALSPFAAELQRAYGLQLAPGGSAVVNLEGQPVVAVSHRSSVAIQAADLVLTLPGSNTMEIAALQRPMVVALPLYRPEEIPLDGLAGMAGRIPLIGRPLKRYLVLQYGKRVPFAALPNKLAGRYIAPELRGESLQPWEVTTVAYELLMNHDLRERVALELHSAVGGGGAARALVADLLSLAAE